MHEEKGLARAFPPASQAAEQSLGNLGLRVGRAEGDHPMESVVCSGNAVSLFARDASLLCTTASSCGKLYRYVVRSQSSCVLLTYCATRCARCAQMREPQYVWSLPRVLHTVPAFTYRRLSVARRLECARLVQTPHRPESHT